MRAIPASCFLYMCRQVIEQRSNGVHMPHFPVSAQIRLTNGAAITNTFRPDDSLSAVFAWVRTNSKCCSSHLLCTWVGQSVVI